MCNRRTTCPSCEGQDDSVATEGPANSTRSVAGCQGLLFSLFFRKSFVFTVSAGPVVAWSPEVPEFPYILSSLISELGNTENLLYRDFCEK